MQRLHWIDPVTKTTANVIRPIVVPIRLLFKPLTLRRQALELEAARLAAAEAAASRPWVVAGRMAYDGRVAALSWLAQRQQELGTFVFR